jgi:peroxiredoxin
LGYSPLSAGCPNTEAGHAELTAPLATLKIPWDRFPRMPVCFAESIIQPEITVTGLRKMVLSLALMVFAVSLSAGDTRSAIHPDAMQVQPLLPGMTAPEFEVRDASGEPVVFDPESMESPLVLSFFRGGWCPYCNLHLAEMRKAEGELEKLGFDIWFISIDRPELLYESLEQPDIGYRVLSDSKLSATRAFGLAFRMPDDLVEKYLEYDIDLEGASGEIHHVLPAPSTYLIGSDGVIRFQYTNPDYKVRLHPDVLIAAARSYTRDEDNRLKRQYKARKKS